MTKEEADRRKTQESTTRPENVNAHNSIHHHHIPSPIRTTFDGETSEIQTPASTTASPRSPVDRVMRKAHKQVEKTASEKEDSNELVPDRTLRTTDEGPGRNSTTLPVVEEVGEGSEISKKNSRNSRQRSQSEYDEKTANTIPGPPAPVNSQDFEKNTRSSICPIIPSSNVEEPSPSLSAPPQTQSQTSSNPDSNEKLTLPAESPRPPPQRPTADGPPRLDSDLIPHFTPLYASPNALDPEKSVLRMDGEVVEGVEKLPGLALGIGGGRATT